MNDLFVTEAENRYLLGVNTSSTSRIVKLETGDKITVILESANEFEIVRNNPTGREVLYRYIKLDNLLYFNTSQY